MTTQDALGGSLRADEGALTQRALEVVAGRGAHWGGVDSLHRPHGREEIVKRLGVLFHPDDGHPVAVHAVRFVPVVDLGESLQDCVR